MASTYKVLGQAAPSGTTDVNLYTVPASTSTVVSSLVIANVTASDANVRVFIRVGGAAAAQANAVAYDVKVTANSHVAFTEGWTLAATDIITVRTATANALTFTLFGEEIQ